MATKSRTQYSCTNCGGTTMKMMGKCPHCGSWNSIVEELIAPEPSTEGRNRYQSITNISSKVENLEDVIARDYERKSTGIGEFDRVLGGGLVDGGVILIGGDPGIGKSTLLLQTVTSLARNYKTLYISGEESPEQIALRGRRLNLNMKGVRIYSEIELEKIIYEIEKEQAQYVVVDSIQTLFSSRMSSAPGSVSQVKECASQLNRLCKEKGVTIIMICHVTKEGELAGPRALEHIVDTVLYFEGDKNNQYRMVRASKNRFGTVNEIGLFAMTSHGLEEVTDPAGIFVEGQENTPGSCVFVSMEGNRAILVEIQALLDQTPLPNPIRRSIGLDINRLQMLCAVVNKFFKIPVYSCNVFVSLIGGIKISDTGVDLPTFVAIVSSFSGNLVIEKTAFFGEIGLTGELRQVQNVEDRIREAARLGMKRVIIPPCSKRTQKDLEKFKSEIEVIECKYLTDVYHKAFKPRKASERGGR